MWGLIRRDLGEFVNTIKDDAAMTFKSAMSLGNKEDEGYDSYYDSDEEEDDDEEGNQWRDGKAPRGQQQRACAALRAIRADIKTYTEEIPEIDAARFDTFSKSFDVGSRTEEIAMLLKEDPVVTKIHTQLVPQHVPYDDFWSRYFFRAERLAQGREVGGGRSFPRHDEEEEEEFGWGEDDQDDDCDERGEDRQNDNDSGAPAPATTARAGGALGAMNVAEDAEASGERDLDDADVISVPSGAVGKCLSSEGGVSVEKEAVASGAVDSNDAEFARLKEALRASEVERASMVEALAEVKELKRERDAALTETVELRMRVRKAEKEVNQAVATGRESAARVEELQHALDASEARAAAAVKEASTGVGGSSDEMAGAAAAAAQEVSRLKKVLREERAQHEEMLMASRQVANEAVEAALSSADADREEACAEATASIRIENQRKDEELEALRSQLAKSAEAMEEVGTLKSDVFELHRVVESEREAAIKAAGEAKQEAEVAKQLREEVRALRAAADQARNATVINRGGGGAGGLVKRGTNRSDVGGEDTDGWGEDEYDSCCAASSSSGVVVDRPPSLASPDRDNEVRRQGDRQIEDVAAEASAIASAASPEPLVSGDSSGGSGVEGGSKGGNKKEGTGSGEGEVGEGDDGWEGWD